MKWARSSLLAWSLFGLTLACFASVLIVSRDGPGDGQAETEQIIALVVFGLAVLVFVTVGAVVASRVPNNPIGWLCILMALLPAIAGLGDEYVFRALEPSSELPGAGYVAITQTFWNSFIALPGMLLLMFPTGRPPGRRWRYVGFAIVAGLTLLVGADLVRPTTDYEGLRNPLGIEALRSATTTADHVGGLLIAAGALTSFASLLFRFARAGSEERQQLKLLAYSLALIAIGVVLGAVFEMRGNLEASNAVISGSLISIPISIGFAVLKHRLYDIDRIINRTIVYAVLTAVLGLAYLALVFVLQQALSPVTEESDLAIAASTLAVAALFGPVRRRLQSFIDRRFYRRRFDAAKTVDEFNLRLRDEVDIEHLSSRLVSVVSDTVQPAHVSLWLRASRS
jgi:hypothetical protein